MVFVFKLAVLIYCIRHVLNSGRPGRTALLYAGSFLVAGLIFAIFRHFSLGVAINLSITFLYDMITGFVFFWLIDRYHGNLLAFYSIIILGITVNLGIQAFFVYRLTMGAM